MKKIYFLLALFVAVFTFSPIRANEVTIPDPTSGTALTTTTYLPIAINTGSSQMSHGCYSVSQQLYYATELTGNSTTPSSTTIQAITFYYTQGTKMTRKLRVWMANSSLANLPSATNTPNFVEPGTKVFSGDVELDESKGKYTITFDTPFEWDRINNKNIIVTVFDSTGRFNQNSAYDYEPPIYDPKTQMFEDAGKVRYLHNISQDKDFDNAAWTMDNLTAATAYSTTAANRKYANRITFTFEDGLVPPSGLAVSSFSATSATLTWSEVAGADSYNLQQSANGSDWSSLTTGVTGTSYTWTGLTAESTQYVRICTVKGEESSDWSDAVTVTTDAIHSHNGIEFDKWSSTNSLPTSGNYYLENDVTLDPYNPQTITLTGNLNLCLNGNTANLYGTKIVVPDGKTLAIYDNVGEGKLTGFVLSEAGMENYSSALIVVKSGGTLVLKEGSIENTYEPDEDGDCYAIYSNGTINLSGDVTINSYTADIYLYSSNVITITGTLSNTEKHAVYKNGGTFTSGWSTYMSSEDPSDYFESADDAKAVYFNGSEAALRTVLHLSENSTNASIGTNYNQTVDVSLTRSFTSAQYNTICLPFALTNEQLQSIFGTGYDLEEFSSSSLEDEILNLAFNKVTALEAGKPYLIQPSQNVVNPTLDGVTITATAPADQTSDTYISFHGTFSPTELEGGNRNLLFLGTGNELFWPESTGNLNGFRAYFEIKDASAQAAKRARISMGGKIATGNLSPTLPQGEGVKILRDGKLYLIYKGQMYDVQGKRI